MVSTLVASRRGPFILGGLLLAVLIVALMNDGAASLATQGLSTRTVRLANLVTRVGLSGYMFAISAAVAAAALLLARRADSATLRQRLRLVAERAIYVFVVIAAAGLGVQLVKQFVGRGRPKLFGEFGAYHFEPFAARSIYASFPSGHTANAFAAAVALGFIFPRARLPLLALAALVGASRVLVGAHYPSDVVVGGSVGVMTAIVVARVFARRFVAFDATRSDLRLKPLPAPARIARP